MSQTLLVDGSRYAIYVLEVCVGALLVWRGTFRHLRVLCVYVSGLFLLDGVARSFVLNLYGISSTEYYHFYWLTDFALAVGAFLLVCALFQRACAHAQKMWGFVRWLLVLVFLLVGGISAVTLLNNYSQPASRHFAFEFSQNLYFACLVLITLLYVMIQQYAIEDDCLSLLVSGFGIQFAGQAACFALLTLSPGGGYAERINDLVAPGCTLGMLLIWAYAIAKTPQEAPARLRASGERAWVGVAADS